MRYPHARDAALAEIDARSSCSAAFGLLGLDMLLSFRCAMFSENKRLFMCSLCPNSRAKRPECAGLILGENETERPTEQHQSRIVDARQEQLGDSLNVRVSAPTFRPRFRVRSPSSEFCLACRDFGSTNRLRLAVPLNSEAGLCSEVL